MVKEGGEKALAEFAPIHILGIDKNSTGRASWFRVRAKKLCIPTGEQRARAASRKAAKTNTQS